MQDISSLVKDYYEIFKSIDVKNTPKLCEIGNNLYDAIYSQYDYAYSKNNVKQQIRLCEIAKEMTIKLSDAHKYCMSDNERQELIILYKICFALSARRDMRQFAIYMERDRRKKVWDKTMHTMESVFYHASKFLYEEDFNLLRVSCMPGLGKSYFGNLCVAQILGNDPNMSILRITFSDDLVEITTKQTKALMRTKAYREIFPRYLSVSDKDMFKVDKANQFVLCDCEDETSFNAVTRDGQATGKRAKLVVIDDLLKGALESNNINLQLSLVDRYDSDWSSRADDDKQKTLLLGTMWANGDLLNVLYDRACEDDVLKRDTTFKFTEIQEVDGVYYSAFIGIPAIDPISGESTCPQRFTTEKLLKKKSHMSSYLWSAVYMQDPIAPDGLEFTWEQLSCYENLSKEVPITIRASLDPARKGKNYVSMPIFAQYKDDDRWYLIDCLYRKLSMKELYQDICYKIISNKVNQLVVENNTDTSLKHVLEEMLKSMNYYNCTIYEMYSYQNKEQRIKDNQGDVRNKLVFPRKNLFNESTEVGQFMQSVTSYSFSYPNKFDDAIDSAVLFIQKFVDNSLSIPKMSSFNRRSLGI